MRNATVTTRAFDQTPMAGARDGGVANVLTP